MKPLEKVAVIDVGSNSCRMVIYERAGSALIPYFNEKAMAGLGRKLPKTGMLNPEGVVKALDTFRRFRAILDGLEIERTYAVATAAVREAGDRDEFIAQAEKALGVPLRVLSGAEEGQLSSLGVKAGFRQTKGIVGDLGGTSLELQRTDKGASEDAGETFLLGPLARADDRDLSVSKRRKNIRKILSESKLLADPVKQLFAVGGAWRNVAAVHMALTSYPLGVAHAYQLDRKALATVIEAAEGAEQHSGLRGRLQAIAKRRYDTLLHAALVLDVLVELAEAETVSVSAFGLREGVVSEAEALNAADGLLDTAELYFKFSEASSAFGRKLYRFLEPVTDGLSPDAAVLEAACLMADAGARLHPDHRCQLVFEQILRAPLPGLSHQERLFVAYAVATRYSFKFDMPKDVGKLISKQLIDEARILGTAMRLGGVYSGRTADVLGGVALERSKKSLRLNVLEDDEDMLSGAVKRRLSQLASLMELEPVWEFVTEI